MSGKKPAIREREYPADEQGSSDALSSQAPRSSPLHLDVSQPSGGDVLRRERFPIDVGAQQSTGRTHVSPIQAPAYADSHHHHEQAFRPEEHQPSTRRAVTTVTPDSRGLLAPELMSPPLSVPRRRSGGSVSTMSVSPSKRTRIGEFLFSSPKYFSCCFRSVPMEPVQY